MLPPADLEAIRTEAEALCGRSVSEQELCSFPMYPRVFADFCEVGRTNGPVSVLPTPIFFYGMRIGQEISVSLERGKTLVIRLQAVGEADDEGQVRVFFELNGQPRVIKVRSLAAADLRPSTRKADEANEMHVAAPLPGTIAGIATTVGQKVKAGDILLTIEAMKMQVSVRAGTDGRVVEILVKDGGQVQPKDLLVVLE